MKIDWKRKLTSRKFWAALIGFATAIVTAFKIESITPQQVELIMTATATLIVYIIGEGFTDIANKPSTGNTVETVNAVDVSEEVEKVKAKPTTKTTTTIKTTSRKRKT